MTNQTPLTEKIQNWLLTHSKFKNASVELLLGDGSTRSFYRIAEKQSYDSAILLSDPQWTQTHDYPLHQKALKEAGILVPEFFSVDDKAGFLLMEDLGDTSLQKALHDHPEKKDQLLHQAVLVLAQLHTRLYPVSKNLPASKRSFDVTKLFEECLFTVEHLRKGFLGLPELSAPKKEAVRALCEKVALVTPLVFCHRDYHSRNLFIKNSQLYMIDFQDARLGPAGYDLASLLYDPYFLLDDETRSHLIAQYKKNSSHPVEELGLIAFQRVFKAAGSFASFYTRFHKDLHLKYLNPALLILQQLEASGQVPKEFTEGFEIDLLLERLKGKKQ